MRLPATSPLSVEMKAGAEGLPVGRLAMDRGRAVFEYDAAFISAGLSLHPLWGAPSREPIAARNPRTFEGLHGVFADSVPDAWGRELMRRRCAREGLDFDSLMGLERLALVGERAMGALAYRPAVPVTGDDAIDLDVLAIEAHEILEGRDSDVLLELERLGGSSGGARPKVLVALNDRDEARSGVGDIPDGYEAWLVKFANSHDVPDIGPLEAAYVAMARASGLRVPDHRLIAAKRGPGYFASKRFDRGAGAVRKHVISAAGVLDLDWAVPQIDYDNLLRLVRAVTRDQQEVEEMFRRMVFNVAAHNRDDHAKQHAFIYEQVTKRWTLAPAYDLSNSSGPGGEHYLAVAGEGRNVSARAVKVVAHAHDIKPRRVREIVAEVLEGVEAFEKFAADYDLSVTTRTATSRAIAAAANRLGELA
jgi:serine/threonine-protein kinase HipA